MDRRDFLIMAGAVASSTLVHSPGLLASEQTTDTFVREARLGKALAKSGRII